MCCRWPLPSHLYHTVNGLTLLRYHVLANQPDAPAEVRYIVDRMIDEVLAVDPYFLGAPDAPLDLRQLGLGDSLEAQAFASWQEALHEVPNEAFFQEFDAALGRINRAGWPGSTRMPKRPWPAPFARCWRVLPLR